VNKRKILLILGILLLLYGFINVWGAYYLNNLNDITKGNVDELFIRGLLFCFVGIIVSIASIYIIRRNVKNGN